MHTTAAMQVLLRRLMHPCTTRVNGRFSDVGLGLIGLLQYMKIDLNAETW